MLAAVSVAPVRPVPVPVVSQGSLGSTGRCRQESHGHDRLASRSLAAKSLASALSMRRRSAR